MLTTPAPLLKLVVAWQTPRKFPFVARGLICAVCSGLTSAVNSLVMERLMKGETDPYVVQNVRLNVGSVFFNFLFLFVMGWIGDAESPVRTPAEMWSKCSGSACMAIEGFASSSWPSPPRGRICYRSLLSGRLCSSVVAPTHEC